MFSIYIKELKQYFWSMIGYVFLALFILVCGVYFVLGNLLAQNGDIKVFFANIFTILLFLMPILTMRLFAEERRMRTLPLLFSLPVSVSSIVLGKFFATLTVFLIGLGSTLVYPFILQYYGVLDILVTIGNYVGLGLLVAAFIAIGMFISALTEKQIIAAIGSYSLLLALWLLDSFAGFVNIGGIRTVINHLSLSYSFKEFTFGIFNPVSIVYFISVTIFFLFMCTLTLKYKRVE